MSARLMFINPWTLKQREKVGTIVTPIYRVGSSLRFKERRSYKFLEVIWGYGRMGF